MAQKTLMNISIDKIHVDPQVRTAFNEESIQELAQNIRHTGLASPISIRLEGGKYHLIHGERRLRALIAAGETSVLALVDSREMAKSERLLTQLSENLQREELSPLETARAVRQLIEESGWSASQVAEKLGRSNGYISRILALTTLSAEIQADIASGRIAASAAYELSKIEDAEERSRVAAELIAGKMTRDGVVARRRGASESPASDSSPTALSRVTAMLGAGRSVTVAGPSMTLDSFIAWLEELLVKAKKTRNQGIEIFTFIKMLRDQAKV